MRSMSIMSVIYWISWMSTTQTFFTIILVDVCSEMYELLAWS